MTDAETIEQDGGGRTAPFACVALVPVAQTLRAGAIPHLLRPDLSFVAHLVATAQKTPQTCRLRRAGLDEASVAYRRSATTPHTAARTLRDI